MLAGAACAAPRIDPRCRPSTCSRWPASSCSSRCACRARRRSRCRSPSTTRRASPSTCRTPTLALPSRRIDVHASGLDTILAAETKDRTRLVLNLDKLVPYDTRVERQQHRGAARCHRCCRRRGCRGSRQHAEQLQCRDRRQRRRRCASCAGIDFRRSADGAGRVIVKLSDPHTHINLHQVGNQIVVDFS